VSSQKKTLIADAAGIADPTGFCHGCLDRFSQARLTTGGDESIYCATRFSSDVRTAVAMPPLEKSAIGRNLQTKIDGVKFTARDGSQTMPLKAMSATWSLFP